MSYKKSFQWLFLVVLGLLGNQYVLANDPEETSGSYNRLGFYYSSLIGSTFVSSSIAMEIRNSEYRSTGIEIYGLTEDRSHFNGYDDIGFSVYDHYFPFKNRAYFKIGIGALARRYADNYFTASIGLGNQWVVWDDRLILGLRFLEDTVTLNTTGKMLNFFTIIGIELGRNFKD